MKLMYGGDAVEKYENITQENLNDYLSLLINQVYSLLPMYEDTFLKEELDEELFESRRDNIVDKVVGFFNLYQLDTLKVLDILSYLSVLKNINNHKEFRRIILKSVNLLSSLKVGDSE